MKSRWNRGCWASQRRIFGVLWLEALSSTKWTSSCAGTLPSIVCKNFRNSTAPVAAVQRSDHMHVDDVERGVEAGRAVPLIVVRRPFGRARDHRRRGRSAWICLFSSTQSTRARSGGFKYRPQMSWTFSMNEASLESFEVS